MEQETKFTIKNENEADLIWNEILEGTYGKGCSAETVELKAVYYDTEDQALRDNKIAFRVRNEGNICFATLKWGGNEVINGLFKHEEANIPVDSETSFTNPPIELFEDAMQDKKISYITKDKKLEELCKTSVTRRRIKLHYNESIVEVAIDQGFASAGNKSTPISEIEVELYAGVLDDVISLTDSISSKYQLEPENRSKFQRALELLD